MSSSEQITYPRDVPCPEGMPPGWKGIEKQYGPGSKSAGQTYIRFYSLDGRHKHILSPLKAIEKDAEDKGYDVNKAIKAYNDATKARHEREAARRLEEREAKGILKGQNREEAVNFFQEKHGPLSGPVVHALPGWKTRWDFMPNCGQVHVAYIEPDGTEWKLLKDLEAAFGSRMKRGEDLTELIDAGKAMANPTSFTEGSSTAKATQGSFESTGPEAPGVGVRKPSRHSRHGKRARPEDYEESQLAVAASGSQALASAPNGADLTREAEEISKLLVERGFPKTTEMVAAFGRSSGSKMVEMLSGVYYELPVGLHGRPTYQKIHQDPQRPTTLICRPLYIFWCEPMARWKIGALDNGLAGYAYCAEDRPRPADLQGHWLTRVVG
mmetsp:Transcript_9307/g.20712  ORF Transcript_9307/g.20712 Transcript_9307/m.20712 type:complete len:383 (+) Transcript_9307:58-1206(+)